MPAELQRNKVMPEEGSYLIERHTILTAPSIQVLQLTCEKRDHLAQQDSTPIPGSDALSVIVSLWKAPDDTTKLLMTEFYKNLQTNPDKTQTLRQAMLTTKATNLDPFNWAAFIALRA